MKVDGGMETEMLPGVYSKPHPGMMNVPPVMVLYVGHLLL